MLTLEPAIKDLGGGLHLRRLRCSSAKAMRVWC